MGDTECPVCFKQFPVATIEEHVSKCLFLNEQRPTQSDTQPGETQDALKKLMSRSKVAKSHASQSDTSPPAKKAKILTSRGKTQAVFTSPKNQEKKSPFLSSSSPKTQERKPSEASESGTSSEVKSSKRCLLNGHAPLAERMRPTTMQDYLGQTHVLGPNTVLSQLLNKGEIPNIILWGPPGCGKTSLANVIQHMCKESRGNRMRYSKLSAAMSGVGDVKEAIAIASNELKFGRRTVLFMDEIHRFNKLQQDIFLPHVEAGTITLIGATTENPSFSLNSALLSRCRVIVLDKLTTENLVAILKRAVESLRGRIHEPGTTNVLLPESQDPQEFLENCPRFLVDQATIQWLADTCDGDARVALGGLELAVQSKTPRDEEILAKQVGLITLEDIKESLKKTHMLYDRKGDYHYDMISALHKSVRASDENASLYWLARMMAGGEDPVYIARRLVRMACEDVGLEDPKALGIAIHTMHGCKMIGMPESDVLLAQCVIYLARAPKSRLMEDALRAAQRLIANHKGPQPDVPLHLRNAPTKLMGNLGYGKGYNMLNKEESGLNYLPEGLEDVDFFN